MIIFSRLRVQMWPWPNNMRHGALKYEYPLLGRSHTSRIPLYFGPMSHYWPLYGRSKYWSIYLSLAWLMVLASPYKASHFPTQLVKTTDLGCLTLSNFSLWHLCLNLLNNKCKTFVSFDIIDTRGWTNIYSWQWRRQIITYSSEAWLQERVGYNGRFASWMNKGMTRQ